MTARLLLFLGMVMVFTSCSQKQVYDSLHQRNLAECRGLLLPQQQDCIDSVQTVPYAEYEREIKKAAER